jgi:transcriptional regulator with XRE-family HTH domain
MIMKDEKAAGTPVARFAEELRAWRLLRGWTQAELGTEMGYSGSHVSSLETMERMPTAEFAQASDKVFGTPRTFQRLRADIARAAHPPWFTPYVHLEEIAVRIHCWDTRSFTGLLQNGRYARAIIRAGHQEDTDDDVERDVMARIERQRVLDRDHPPSCWFVIGEAAFRTRFGDDDVMREQIDHIAELAARPYIHIQVLSFTVPDSPGADGPVTVFDFEGQPSAGYAEGYEAGRIIEAPQEVAKLTAMFDHVRAVALSPRDSVSWIAAFRSELYGSS